VTVRYEEDLSVRVRVFGFTVRKPGKKEPELKEAEEIMVQAMEVKEPEFLKESPEVKEKTSGRIREEDGSLPQPEEELKEIPPPTEKTKKKKRFGITELFKGVRKKVLKTFAKLKFFFRRICDTLKTIKDKKDEIHAWISNKDNQKTVKLLLKQGKKLVRHVLPRRGKGNITFGFDDPYLTGQVLTYASVIYPLCHKHLNLYPVFDRKVFLADGHFRGRIRGGTVFFIGLRMLLDKNFRRLLKEWLHKGGIA
jgi:hypothetical protein